MKKYIIFIFLLFWGLLVTAQYSLERHTISYSGGEQSNSLYTVTSSGQHYQASAYQNSLYSGNSGFLYPELHTLPPAISNIYDVPNDQGKQVHVNWNKSDYDKNYDPDKFYSVWRQDDDGLGDANTFTNLLEVIQNSTFWTDNYYWNNKGVIWSYIDTIPALGFENYSLVAPTLFDSLAGDPGLSTFMVVFHDKFAYYESQPDSGYSVDNLAPAAPVLDAILIDQSAELNWTESTEEDFQYYAIYKSETEGNFPAEPFTTTIINSFTDPDLTSDTTYYWVSSFDFNGNKSLLSNVALVPLHNVFELEITVFLEGPFENWEMAANLSTLLPLSQPFGTEPWYYNGLESVLTIPQPTIVDWILIEAHDAPHPSMVSPATIVDRQAAFLLSNGQIVNFENGNTNPVFTSTISNNLFVIVRHRNHLPVLSSSTLQKTGNTYSFNFSTSGDQAFGNNQNLLTPGIYGLIGGDINADQSIDEIDLTHWKTLVGEKGYFSDDTNLDGQINNPDKNDVWLPNNGKSSNLSE